LTNYYPQYPPDIWNSTGMVSVTHVGRDIILSPVVVPWLP
jgi:hypothetical protein